MTSEFAEALLAKLFRDLAETYRLELLRWQTEPREDEGGI